MIENVSRYYDGPLIQIPHKYTGVYTIGVFRKFPDTIKRRYIDYIWVEGDSLPILADQYGDGAKYWWEIMEINPEITNPFNIAPGTPIRIPYGSQQ